MAHPPPQQRRRDREDSSKNYNRRRGERCDEPSLIITITSFKAQSMVWHEARPQDLRGPQRRSARAKQNHNNNKSEKHRRDQTATRSRISSSIGQGIEARASRVKRRVGVSVKRQVIVSVSIEKVKSRKCERE
jgi:hypothetical protein